MGRLWCGPRATRSPSWTRLRSDAAGGFGRARRNCTADASRGLGYYCGGVFKTPRENAPKNICSVVIVLCLACRNRFALCALTRHWPAQEGNVPEHSWMWCGIGGWALIVLLSIFAALELRVTPDDPIDELIQE